MPRETSADDTERWEQLTAEHTSGSDKNLNRVRELHATAIAVASTEELKYRLVVIKHSIKEGQAVLADVEKELERRVTETTDGS